MYWQLMSLDKITILEQENHPRNKEKALFWPMNKCNESIFGQDKILRGKMF